MSVELGAVKVQRGGAAEPAPIGQWITVREPTELTVEMVVVTPEEL